MSGRPIARSLVQNSLTAILTQFPGGFLGTFDFAVLVLDFWRQQGENIKITAADGFIPHVMFADSLHNDQNESETPFCDSFAFDCTEHSCSMTDDRCETKRVLSNRCIKVLYAADTSLVPSDCLKVQSVECYYTIS